MNKVDRYEVVILDTETTGLTPTDEVIQLAYFPISFDALHLSQEVAKEHGVNLKFRPSVPINPFASKVNGVQYVDLLECPPSKTLVPPDASYVIGHNISFDSRLMLQTAAEHHTPLINSYKYICTLELARGLDKHHGIGYANHKLDTLFDLFFPDKENPEVHDALFDCVKTGLVLSKLLELIPGISSFEDLYQFQQTIKTVKKAATSRKKVS